MRHIICISLLALTLSLATIVNGQQVNTSATVYYPGNGYVFYCQLGGTGTTGADSAHSCGYRNMGYTDQSVSASGSNLLAHGVVFDDQGNWTATAFQLTTFTVDPAVTVHSGSYLMVDSSDSDITNKDFAIGTWKTYAKTELSVSYAGGSASGSTSNTTTWSVRVQPH